MAIGRSSEVRRERVSLASARVARGPVDVRGDALLGRERRAEVCEGQARIADQRRRSTGVERPISSATMSTWMIGTPARNERQAPGGDLAELAADDEEAVRPAR